MMKHLAIASLAAAAAALPLTAAVAASVTPQRSADFPASLMKAFSKGVLVNAIITTDGANSRFRTSR